MIYINVVWNVIKCILKNIKKYMFWQRKNIFIYEGKPNNTLASSKKYFKKFKKYSGLYQTTLKNLQNTLKYMKK
jgi:hypothetical protein